LCGLKNGEHLGARVRVGPAGGRGGDDLLRYMLDGVGDLGEPSLYRFTGTRSGDARQLRRGDAVNLDRCAGKARAHHGHQVPVFGHGNGEVGLAAQGVE